MPDCHLCRLNGHPTIRCIKCKGPSVNPANHGQQIVSLEHLPPSEVAKLKSTPPVATESPMADFMRLWLRMPTKTRDLFAQVIADRPRSGAALARQLGVSRQAVHRRLIQAARTYPELKTVIGLRMHATRRGNNIKIENNNTK